MVINIISNLIVQWGGNSTPPPDGQKTFITFPISFSNTSYGFGVSGCLTSNALDRQINYIEFDTNYGSLNKTGSYWVAIGY